MSPRYALITKMEHHNELSWYVLRVTYQRELQAKERLEKLGVHCYVPVKQVYTHAYNKLKKKTVSVIHNYIFVYSTQNVITSIKQQDIPYLRYVMSNSDEGKSEPMTVPLYQMENFLLVTGAKDVDIKFYNPKNVNLKKGDKVRVLGGAFKGLEGTMIKLKNEKFKRIVVQIEGIIGVATESLPAELVEKI